MGDFLLGVFTGVWGMIIRNCVVWYLKVRKQGS